MTDNLTLQKSSTFLILRNTKYNKNHYNNAKKGRVIGQKVCVTNPNKLENL